MLHSTLAVSEPLCRCNERFRSSIGQWRGRGHSAHVCLTSSGLASGSRAPTRDMGFLLSHGHQMGMLGDMLPDCLTPLSDGARLHQASA